MESLVEALNVIFEDETHEIEVTKEGVWLKEGLWLKEEKVLEMMESLLTDHNEAYFVDISEKDKMKSQEVAMVENIVDNQDAVTNVMILDEEKENKTVVPLVEFNATLDYNWWGGYLVASKNVDHSDYNWWYEDEMKMWYPYTTTEFPNWDYAMGI